MWLIVFYCGIAISHTKATNDKIVHANQAQIRRNIGKLLQRLQRCRNNIQREKLLNILAANKAVIPVWEYFLYQEKYSHAVCAVLNKIADKDAYEMLFNYIKIKRTAAAPQAILAMGDYRRKKVFLLLYSLLRSDSRDIQLLALDALGKHRTNSALRALLPLVIHNNKIISRRARHIWAFTSLRPRMTAIAGKILVHELVTTNHGLAYKKQLIVLLGNTRYPKSVTVLQEHLQYDILFAPIVTALGKVGTEAACRVLRYLLDFYHDCDSKRAIAIIRALTFGKTPPSPNNLSAIVACLDNANPRIRRQAINSLEQLTGKDLGENIIAWKFWWQSEGSCTQDILDNILQGIVADDVEKRRRTLEYFLHRAHNLLPSQHIDNFAATFHDAIRRERQLYIRLLLLDALAKIKAPQSIPFLAEMLFASEGKVAHTVVATLIKFPQQRSVVLALHQALTEEIAVETRIAIIEALGKLQNSASIIVLEQELQSEDSRVRRTTDKVLNNFLPME